jgi:hypothetical protein
LRRESYGLVIDSVGEVLKLRHDSREPVPVNLDSRSRASPPAFIDWSMNSWLFSMSRACST